MVYVLSLFICMSALAGCGPGQILTPGELERCCIPAPGQGPGPCNLEQFTVQGRVEPLNVFDKTTYPNLPYEKFRLVGDGGHVLEVYFHNIDSGQVFPELKRRMAQGPVTAQVHGLLEILELPTQHEIRYGIRIRPQGPQDVQFLD